jgi:hypothetical protein
MSLPLFDDTTVLARIPLPTTWKAIRCPSSFVHLEKTLEFGKEVHSNLLTITCMRLWKSRTIQ